jgi:hypothetical protein
MRISGRMDNYIGGADMTIRKTLYGWLVSAFAIWFQHADGAGTRPAPTRLASSYLRRGNPCGCPAHVENTVHGHLIALAALSLYSAEGGECVQDRPCEGVVTHEATFTCCVKDDGCWLNPFEPNGQWWCQTVRFVQCFRGGIGLMTKSWEECGPCCDPENPDDPIPEPVEPPVPASL